MERGLIGILLICLVGSSIPVLLFLGERTKSPVTVLKVEYPERFPSGVPNRFALNVLARKDVEDLTVQYSYLYRVSGDRMEELYKTEGFNESVLSDDDPYRFLIVPSGSGGMREKLPGGDAGFETQRVTVPYSYKREFKIFNVDLNIRFYDFCKMLRWTPYSASPSVYGATTTFAFVSIEEGNISLFRGASDFYLNRDDSLSDLEIGKDGESSLYLNPKIREISDEYTHVNDSPPFGTVNFGNLKKGERAYLSFTTRDISLPAIQVVRFWANGELLEEETRINLLGGPL